MITFKIEPFRDLQLTFIDMNDLIGDGKKAYKRTMVGPYEDITLEALGIIIDGDNEKPLADDLEKIIKRRGRKYERVDQLGVIFYEERSY